MGSGALRAQAEEVIRRLQAKPALYAEVVKLIRSDRTAGPWERQQATQDRGSYYDWWGRRDAAGEWVGQVAPLPAQAVKQGWQWQVRGGHSGDGLTAEDCLVQADAELGRLGYVLK